LVRATESRKKRAPKKSAARAEGEAPAKAKSRSSEEDRRQEALDLVQETFEALTEERGEEERIWGSMVKQALRRRKPGFNESYYGFRSFNALLEEAQKAGLLRLEPDEKSGGYLLRMAGPQP